MDSTLFVGVIVAVINAASVIFNAWVTYHASKSKERYLSKLQHFDKFATFFSLYRIRFSTPNSHGPNENTISDQHLTDLVKEAYALASYCNPRSRNHIYEFVDLFSRYYYQGESCAFESVYQAYVKCVHSIQRELLPLYKRPFYRKLNLPESRLHD